MDPKTVGFVASESSGSVGYSEYPEYFPNFAKGNFDAANFTNYSTTFSLKGEENILFAEAGLKVNWVVLVQEGLLVQMESYLE